MSNQTATKPVNTKVITRKVRFSYLYVFEPRAAQNGGKPKYSVTLLIPKTDKVTIDAINAAIEAVKKTGEKVWGSALSNPKTSFHDGDGPMPNSGEPYGAECKGCMVLNCSTDTKPGLLDAAGNKITDMDKDELYSGCYGRASVNFYAYNNSGNKGVGCGLNNLQKLADGESLTGRKKAEEDFETPYEDELFN